MPVLLRPAAAADVDEAFLWYERQRAGLGNEFLAALQSALRRRAPQRARSVALPATLQPRLLFQTAPEVPAGHRALVSCPANSFAVSSRGTGLQPVGNTGCDCQRTCGTGHQWCQGRASAALRGTPRRDRIPIGWRRAAVQPN